MLLIGGLLALAFLAFLRYGRVVAAADARMRETCEWLGSLQATYLFLVGFGVLAAAHLLRKGYLAARHRQFPAPGTWVLLPQRVRRGTNAEILGLLQAVSAVALVVLLALMLQDDMFWHAFDPVVQCTR